MHEICIWIISEQLISFFSGSMLCEKRFYENRLHRRNKIDSTNFFLSISRMIFNQLSLVNHTWIIELFKNN